MFCFSHLDAKNSINILLVFSIDVTVRFIQDRFFGSEETGSVVVILELVGGSSSRSFDVIVSPSEQSPVSATGKSYSTGDVSLAWPDRFFSF